MPANEATEKFQFDSDAVDKMVSLCSPLLVSCELAYLSKSTDDKVFSERELFKLKMQNIATDAIEKYKLYIPVSPSDRELKKKNILEKINKLEDLIDDAIWSEISIHTRGGFTDDCHGTDELIAGLRDKISQSNYLYEYDDLSVHDRTRYKFISHAMTIFQAETGKAVTRSSNGDTANFLIQAWNPIASFVNQNEFTKDKIKFLSPDSAANEIKKVWVNSAEE